MSNKCNIPDALLAELQAKFHVKTQGMNPTQVMDYQLGVLASMEKKLPGITEQFKTFLESSTKHLLPTTDEMKRFDVLLDKTLNGNKQGLSNLSTSEKAELFTIGEKMARVTGLDPNVITQVKALFAMARETKPEVTIDAIELLEKEKAVALRNGDTEMAAKLDKAIAALGKAGASAKHLKIDWEALDKAKKTRDLLLAESALLSAFKRLGDSHVVAGFTKSEEKRKELLRKLNEKQTEKRNLRNSDQDQASIDEQSEDIDVAIAEIREQLMRLDRKILQGLPSSSRKRRDKLDAELAKIQLKLKENDIANSQLGYIETLVNTAMIDDSWFLSSARDLFVKKKQVDDHIKFVQTTITQAPEDKQYTRAEVERLFGKGIASLPMVRGKFIEITEDPATKKQISKEKEFISRNEVLDIYENWAEIEKESIYDPRLDAEEAQIAADLVRSKQKDLITDVDPNSPQPVVRTRVDAMKKTLGFSYNSETIEGRTKLVTDLQRVLGRLNTLSKLPEFSGLIPEWALVSALGSDAQSLFTLFDSALENPQGIIDDDAPIYFEDDHQRRMFLMTLLTGLGVDSTKFNLSPENRTDFIKDFRKIIGISFERNNEGKIISISQTIRAQDPGSPPLIETRPLITSSAGIGQPLTMDDANAVLTLLEEQMDSGFKIVGHDILQADGAMEALVLQAQNAKQGLRISVRMYDTGLIAFKGSLDNQITRFNTPTLTSLAFSFADITIPTNLTMEQTLEVSSKAVIDVLLGMEARSRKDIAVTHNNKSFILNIDGVTPLWYDGNGNQKTNGQNPNYKGANHLFDIQVFQNLKTFRGSNIGKPSMYNLSKVQSIATNLMIVAIEETNPEELNNILTGLVATPSQIDKHHDLVMKLSRQNHEAYLPILQEQRAANDNQFILSQSVSGDGQIVSLLSTSAVEYVDLAVKEVFETLRAYKREASWTISEFAKLIGFRPQEADEQTTVYLSKLFIYLNKKANEKELSLVDYGNGTFDYISAKQLGRGFAQVILGHVREGNTLTQNIDVPIGAAAITKEARQSDGTPLQVTDIEGNIEERQYLPLTRTNVSYFAPLSMYEQERAYSDFALRKRYMHILSRTLDDKDRTAFVKFVKENRIVEFRNAIQSKKAEISEAKEKKQDTTKLEKELTDLKTAYNNYMEDLDSRRLEQGRVQQFELLNPVNNRDLYTRIPTIEESIEMSLEVALELPQLVASWVHDSRNFVEGSQMNLAESSYMRSPGMSSGGPGAKSTWSGIHPLMGHLLMYPEQYKPTTVELDQMIADAKSLNDSEIVKKLEAIRNGSSKEQIVNVSRDILKAALQEGYKARREGMAYSKSTYFDDKFSGIHHIVAAQEAYKPSYRKGGKNLLQSLLEVKNGGLFVSEDQIDDYYEKTYQTCIQQTEKLRERINGNKKLSKEQRIAQLAQLDRIISILVSHQLQDGSGKPSSTARSFFKGVVIPIIYSGGYDAVLKNLLMKRDDTSKSKPGDPPTIGDLSNSDIALLAHTLTASGGQTYSRLIDEIMDLDLKPNAESRVNTKDQRTDLLIDLLTGDTDRLKKTYALNISQLGEKFPEVKDAYISNAVLKELIKARIRYVAELSIKPSDVMLEFESAGGLKTQAEIRDELVNRKTNEIMTKWNDRIQKAEKRLEEYYAARGDQNKQVGFEIGSEIEREISVILAGGMGQYKTQASLLFLNSAQNSGYRLNASSEALIEHQVKTGRYISPNDLMFTNAVVFMHAGYGTTTGRMEYPGNYLSNIQGGSLSKGLRLVYDKDGKLDVKESVLGSMWTLTNNPLENLSKDEARTRATDLAIKNYALHLATDYDPEYLGYSKDNESRENFFREWQERSQEEKGFTHRVRAGGDLRDKYRQIYRDQQIAREVDPAEVETITDEDIDKEISSNSVALDKRETTRIMAPDVLTHESGTLITAKDAKGLGAFIPRIADHAFEDRIVHGLYTMHHHSKQLRLKGGKALLQIRTAKEGKIKTKDILDSRTLGSSVHDPESLPFVPVTGDSLPEFLLDHEPAMMQKAAALQNTLDSFAYEFGYEDLVKTKDYARLYQIYQITLHLRKLTNKLHKANPDTITTRELQMEHRTFVMNLFKLTKFQRDASKQERSILNFRRAVNIDPSKFKYADGTNMSYMDALKVLADLGIDELYTLKFGIYPTELAVLGEEQVDVLKKASTIIRPFYVQGSDVAVLMMAFLSDSTIKKRATEIVERKVKEGRLTKITTDKQGFVLLSELPETIIDDILDEVLQDDALVNSAVNNLNLYVTLEWGMNANATNIDGKPRAKIHVQEHAEAKTAFIIPRPGIGDPTVNRTRIGFQQAKFMLTAEAAKRILTGARNNNLLKKMEVAIQTNKFIGTRTNVDTLRSENFRQIGEDRVKQVAEEVELLQRLMGTDRQLKMLLTRGQSELRDEFGLTLNPYDAESYFYDDGQPTIENPNGTDSYRAMNPFMSAISSNIRQSIKTGSAYITLNKEVSILQDFYNGKSENFIPVSYLIYLKYNAKELNDKSYKTLVQEAMGIDNLSDEKFTEIKNKANELIAIMDKINFSPTKGRNPYLSLALQTLEKGYAVDTQSQMDLDLAKRVSSSNVQDIPDIQNPGFKVREGHSFRVIKDSSTTTQYTNKDLELKAQALNEAIAISQHSSALDVLAYPNISGIDLVQACFNPDDYNIAIPGPDGERINTELANLVAAGTISEATAVFYRYLIATVFKTNPNLAPMLSITAVNTSSNIAGSAIKDGDKFTIKLNTNILKNMGTVEQVRVFAHEIAHIARMAFIKDNSPEYNRIVSIFRSKRGRDTISTMLLAMNNGKKYMGFDEDVNHYLSHPEEFIAQWGAWILFQKTFNNQELLKFLEQRNRGAQATQHMWQKALHAMSMEITGVAIGLNQLDEQLRNDLLAVVDNMYGFTASEARQVHIENANQQLFMLQSIHEPLLPGEEAELTTLSNMMTRSPAEQERYDVLQAKYQRYSPINLDRATLMQRRQERMRNSGQYAPPRLPGGLITDNSHELEVIDRFQQATLSRAGTQSRAGHTFGGLTRNMAESMFGVNTANNILNAGRSLALLGVSSKYTYDCSDPLMAGLMNIISDTLSTHAYQFQRLGGSQSIRENRSYTRGMIERVVYERDQLQLVSKTKAEYDEAATWAIKRASGITATPPANAEVARQANTLALAMMNNSNRLRTFIYDTFAGFQETLPMQFESDLLGTGDQNKILSGVSSRASRENQARNRDHLRQQLRDMIRNKIQSGHVDANVIYVMHLLPREVTLETLRAFRTRQPNILNAIRDEVIERMEEIKGISTAEATVLVNRIINNNFDLTTTPALTEAHVLQAFNSVIQEIYTRASIGNVDRLSGGRIAAALQAQARLEINTPVNNLTNLTSDRSNVALPQGVMRISSVSAFHQDSLNGDPTEVLANLFLGYIGNNSQYLMQNNIVTMEDLLSNPDTERFVSPRIDHAMYQLERTQGYNVASERAIHEITGISGINIHQLIDMIRRNISNLRVQNPQNLRKALIVLSEKIKIDQGLGIRDITEGHPFFEFIAKWGPDITRIVHGSNLNTASLVVEGGLGAVISTMYGGNGARFIQTLFGSFFSTYRGRNMTQMEQRGAAVNLLLGVERMVQDAREVQHIADTAFDRNAGKVQKLRDWLRQNNNRGFMAVQAAMAEQAQDIIIKNLNNGNIDKLVKIINDANASGNPITNMTELATAMSAAGISKWKLNSHMAWILLQSGLLQDGVLRAYRYMHQSIDKTNTKGHGIDLQAAGRWIERTNWGSSASTNVILGGANTVVHLAHARRAIQATYFITKEFMNIVTVDNNAFDSATSNSVMQSLFFFYRQYPNLFLAQKVFRLAGRMDKFNFGMLLVAASMLDLFYNSLLLVAAGAIPLTALFPWSDEFIGKKDPMALIKIIATRNPVFSPVGNLIMESVIKGKQMYDKTNINKYQNEYTKVKRGVAATTAELMPDFIPLTAAKQITDNILPSAIFGFSTAADALIFGEIGGRVNDQEYWDQMNDLVRVGSRVAGVDLALRVVMPQAVRSVFGERPVRLPSHPITSSPMGTPGQQLKIRQTQPVPTYSTSDLMKQANSPIRAPKGLQ